VNGPEHYAEAERLLDAYKGAITSAEELPFTTPQQSSARLLAATNAHSLLTKAGVHATLALVAVHAESSVSTQYATQGKPVVLPPFRGDEEDPPHPGNQWGRALYGHLEERS